MSIGLELAAKPSILFMDEPTSGLDATAAADILQVRGGGDVGDREAPGFGSSRVMAWRSCMP